MALELETIETLNAVIRRLAFIFLYFLIGFGPGFVVGILLSNRLWGKGHPIYMEVHQENLRKAAEHNKQWHPSHERWKK